MTTNLQRHLGDYWDEFDERIRAKFAAVELERGNMHVYQGEAHQFLLDNPFSALFVDMGLGKTVSAGTLIGDLIDDLFNSDDPELKEGEKVLIVAPKRVAYETWPTEFKIWRHLAHHNLSVIRCDDDDPRLKEAAARGKQAARDRLEWGSDVEKAGRKAESDMREIIRREAAMSRATIHCVSFEWLAWLVNTHAHKWPYRVVIIDELSGFKDHGSDRFKALAKVRNTPGLIRRAHGLTATPAAESYMGFFSQTFLLDGGARFGKFITHYQDDYFTFNKYSRKYKLRTGAKEQILDKLKDITLIMKVEDYLPDLEKPVIVQRVGHLTEKQMKQYQTMEKDFVLELDDGTEIEAETAASLTSRLLQMSSGFLYETLLQPGETEFDDHVKVKKVHDIHNHKIEMMKEIVEEGQGTPILVGYHFKSSLDRLKKAFPNAVQMDDDGKCQKDWNAGKIPMLLMHPQSGGHGLNLQKGPGHNIVFFDIPWSLELYWQFIGRLARQGQKRKVVVQLLTMTGTMDERVHKVLSNKEADQDDMFKILRSMHRKLRKMKLSKA